jgi:lipid-A-disaccharide synthase
MKYFIIAGEASGDLHASNLIKALKSKDMEAEFQFWGGNKMEEAANQTALKHIRDLAFMGFIEVVQNLSSILRNIKLCKQQILDYKPDVLILVDYPGFNLKMAKFAHQANLKVFYYISPKVWAWKQRRVIQIKENVDRMFTILPFETSFYKSYGVEVDYIGNPLMDAIEKHRMKEVEKLKLNDSRPIIALLPGSREQELKRIFPDMLKMVSDFPEHQFVVAATKTLSEEIYSKLIGEIPVKMVYDKTYDVLDQAEAALVTSGTATLETALLNIPQVVCYKANPASYTIAKNLVNIKYISLVNLIMNKEIVVELIQHDLNQKLLKQELQAILKDGVKREKVLADYSEMRERVGGAGASERGADLMIDYLRTK